MNFLQNSTFTKLWIKKNARPLIFFIFCRMIEFCMLFQMVPERTPPLRSECQKRAQSLKLTTLTTLLFPASKVVKINDFNDSKYVYSINFLPDKQYCFNNDLQKTLSHSYKLICPWEPLGSPHKTTEDSCKSPYGWIL